MRMEKWGGQSLETVECKAKLTGGVCRGASLALSVPQGWLQQPISFLFWCSRSSKILLYSHLLPHKQFQRWVPPLSWDLKF